MSRARDLADGTFSGSFSADSPTLVVDDANNRVGVGTVFPSQQITLVNSSSSKIQIKGHSASNGLFIGMDSATAGQFWNAENGYIRFATNDTERLRILSGGGITFNGDTAAANALDDYEEGTWSPFWCDDSDNVIFNASPTVNFAHYTKVGRYVTASCYFNMPGSFGTTGSYNSGGALRIGGLPFTAYASGSNNFYAGSVGWFSNWSWDASGYGFPPMIYTIHNTTRLSIVYPTTNNVSTVLQSKVNVGSSGIILTATYFTQA